MDQRPFSGDAGCSEQLSAMCAHCKIRNLDPRSQLQAQDMADRLMENPKAIRTYLANEGGAEELAFREDTSLGEAEAALACFEEHIEERCTTELI